MTIKALSRLRVNAAAGADPDISFAIAKSLAESLKKNGIPTLKEYEKFYEFSQFCAKVEDTLKYFFPRPCLFVGGDSIVSTTGKSDSNYLEFEDPDKFSKCLVKLNKLGFPFKKNGQIARGKVGSVTVYSELDLDRRLLSFSIESGYSLK